MFRSFLFDEVSIFSLGDSDETFGICVAFFLFSVICFF